MEGFFRGQTGWPDFHPKDCKTSPCKRSSNVKHSRFRLEREEVEEVMQAVSKRNRNGKSFNTNPDNKMGEPIGFFGKLFGCWHKDLSRPFTEKNCSYRVCLDCGARKEFDTDSFQTSGPFYYPPKAVCVN